MNNTNPSEKRLHALDAVRGFALLLGVAFHAALSFMPGWPPGIWAMNDNSPSQFLSDAAFVTHIFRMSLFFFIAGYFGRLLYQKLGARAFWANRGKRIAIPLVAGWVVLFPLIGYHLDDRHHQGVRRHDAAHAGNAEGAGAFPLAHLWFLYQLLLIYVAVDRGARPRRALRSRRTLRGLVDKAVSGSLRAPIAVIHARTAGRRRPDVAVLLVLLDGNPDSGQIADSADSGIGRLTAPPSYSAGSCIARAMRCR